MTTTTVDLTPAKTNNQRGSFLKERFAEVLELMGFTVEIEKPYIIHCNSNPIKIDLVINKILGIETKLYMDVCMAYKYVGPMSEIQMENSNAPLKWAALCGQDANGFAFLRHRGIPCLALDDTIRNSNDVKQQFIINHNQLEVFVSNALQ
tara:strand:- start:19 stop:468 length:450 start_codon:yes stop_codon:yes gene_type:complete